MRCLTTDDTAGNGINHTDVHMQWAETRAVWNKGRHGVQMRIAEGGEGAALRDPRLRAR